MLSPGSTIDIVLSVTSVLRKITNIYKLVFAKDRPRLQDVWAPVTFWIQGKVEAHRVETRVLERLSQINTRVYLGFYACVYVHMRRWERYIMHDASQSCTHLCIMSQGEPPHTQTHTLWPCARRWFQGEGGSALYRIICLGRPLLWTICRFPTRTGVIQANSWRAADGRGCGGIDWCHRDGDGLFFFSYPPPLE